VDTSAGRHLDEVGRATDTALLADRSTDRRRVGAEIRVAQEAIDRFSEFVVLERVSIERDPSGEKLDRHAAVLYSLMSPLRIERRQIGS
jgi:hypothetical protein